MARVVCFVCLKEFELDDAFICSACSWHMCPHCRSCLCKLSPEAARAAIAVYLSHAKLSETYPDLEYNFWLRKAKELEKYMKTKIRVKSPDPNGIYHVWHFCMKCKQAIRHSTASMRDHLHRCRHEPKDFLTFPTTIKEIVIEVSG